MSGAIVAKALNSTMGTADFKGLDEIIKTALSESNEVIETALSENNAVLQSLVDEYKNIMVKDLVASDDPLYYIISNNTIPFSFSSYISMPIANEIIFNTNGSIKVSGEMRADIDSSNSETASGKIAFVLKLNGERIYISKYVDGSSSGNHTKIDPPPLLFKKGDILEFFIEPYHGTAIFYSFQGSAYISDLLISATPVDLTCFSFSSQE